MPIPLLATLNAAARAAYPVIKSGVARGLSANNIQSVLRAQGMGIRRQTLLDIIRAETATERAGAALRFLGLDRIPNPARLPTAITRIRRQYSFVVRVIGRHQATGEQIIQHISVALDAVRTRREIERIASDAVTNQLTTYGLDVDSTMLVSGVRAGSAGTL